MKNPSGPYTVHQGIREKKKKSVALGEVMVFRCAEWSALTWVFHPRTYVLYTRTHVLLSRAFILKMGPVYITVGKAAAQVTPCGVVLSRVHRSSMSIVSGALVHIVNDLHTFLLPFMLLCLFLF